MIKFISNIFSLAFVLIHFLSVQEAECFKIFKIGIFYDDTFDDVAEFVEQSVEQTNNNLMKKNAFKFEFSLKKIRASESFVLKKLGMHLFTLDYRVVLKRINLI